MRAMAKRLRRGVLVAYSRAAEKAAENASPPKYAERPEVGNHLQKGWHEKRFNERPLQSTLMIHTRLCFRSISLLSYLRLLLLSLISLLLS